MQPYFKSMYGAIVPFSNVIAMTVVDITSNDLMKYKTLLLSGAEISKFTFNDLIDHDEQIRNYKTWLVDQYQRSSNVNCIR